MFCLLSLSVFSKVYYFHAFFKCVILQPCLFFCPFSFGHCMVCSSSIYGFWWPCWYLQTLIIYSKGKLSFLIFDIDLFRCLLCQEIKIYFLTNTHWKQNCKNEACIMGQREQNSFFQWFPDTDNWCFCIICLIKVVEWLNRPWG